MHDFLMFMLGLVVGGGSIMVLMSALFVGKKSDIEIEKQISYKEGYKKGFEDGYDLKESHLK